MLFDYSTCNCAENQVAMTAFGFLNFITGERVQGKTVLVDEVIESFPSLNCVCSNPCLPVLRVFIVPEFGYLTIIFRDGNGGLELVSTCLGAQRDLEV